MDAVRRLELQTSLQRELERQAVEQNLTATGRIVWLLDQVENYIDRWRGIGAHSTPVPHGSDLYQMIEIGVGVTTIELQALNSSQANHEWQLLLNILEQIRAGGSTEWQRLTKALEAVRSQLGDELHVETGS